jgi:tetratricopeptide (TPR) repeat protein
MQAVYLSLGRFDRALEAIEEARALWSSLGNLPMLSDSLISSAVQRVVAGDFAKAMSLANDGLALSERIGNVWGQAYARMPIALVQFVGWELGPSIETLQSCLALAERAGFLDPMVSMRSILAVTMARLGDLPAALDHVELAFRAAADRNVRWSISAFSARALLWIMKGDLPKARRDLEVLDSVQLNHLTLAGESSFMAPLAWIEAALLAGDLGRGVVLLDEFQGWSDRLGIHGLDSHLFTYRGILMERMGRLEEARRALDRAVEVTRSQGIGAAAWIPLATLASLEAADGLDAEADRFRREAAARLATIEVGITDPRLRSLFRENVATARTSLGRPNP